MMLECYIFVHCQNIEFVVKKQLVNNCKMLLGLKLYIFNQTAIYIYSGSRIDYTEWFYTDWRTYI